MSETLKFVYDATGPSVTFAVTPLNEEGHVATGTPPTKTMSILDFEAKRPDLFVHLSALIAAEPFYREEATATVKDPNAVQELANANSREAERLRQERLANEQHQRDAEEAANVAKAEAKAAEEKRKADEADSAKAKAAADEAEAKRIAAEAEHAETLAKLEAAKAELAELEVQKAAQMTAPATDAPSNEPTQ